MNIDQEINDRINMALLSLTLETEWIGMPPNVWGVMIRLKHNGYVISETCINLFDEKSD